MLNISDRANVDLSLNTIDTGLMMFGVNFLPMLSSNNDDHIDKKPSAIDSVSVLFKLEFLSVCCIRTYINFMGYMEN